MRLIDADALMNKLDIKEHCDDCVHAYGIYCDKIGSFVEACRAISDAPTIEPKQRWIVNKERSIREGTRPGGGMETGQ